jgi:hypothetical protein
MGRGRGEFFSDGALLLIGFCLLALFVLAVVD